MPVNELCFINRKGIDAMANILLENVKYKVEETSLGTWLRYLYPDGRGYAEFTSHKKMYGLPFIHYTRGICPETGRRKRAGGIIAIGRIAVGAVAIGQAAFGIIAVGQLGIGILFSLAQGAAALAAVGQVALGVRFGLGQLATGYTAIGQLAVGTYVLAQVGFGDHVWSQKAVDPQAVEYFLSLKESVLGFFRNR